MKRSKTLRRVHNRALRSSRAGVTLVELCVALPIVALIMIGVMNLFEGITSATISSSGKVNSANGAGLAMERVIGDIREAYNFALPDDSSGFTPPESYTTSQFETTFNSASIDTGIEIIFDATTTNTVLNSSGAGVAVTPYTGIGVNDLWIYRADSNGAPNASAGQYLWAYGNEEGNAVNGPITRLSDNQTDAAKITNAVQIARPMNTATPPAAIPWQVEIRIISSYFGGATGLESSESSGTNMLTGRVALVRNHG